MGQKVRVNEAKSAFRPKTSKGCLGGLRGRGSSLKHLWALSLIRWRVDDQKSRCMHSTPSHLGQQIPGFTRFWC